MEYIHVHVDGDFLMIASYYEQTSLLFLHVTEQ